MANKNKSKKQIGFFKENYRAAFNYIGDMRNYIYIILILFILCFFIGYFFPIFFVDTIKQFIKNLALQTKDLRGTSLIIFIFKNNFLVSLSSIVFGLILGIIPLIITIINGYVLGFVASFAVSQEGISILWRLFPHGIFEIPAIILSLALGLKLGLSIFDKDFKMEFKSNLENILRVFILVIFPLLVIAAIIEGILVGLV